VLKGAKGKKNIYKLLSKYVSEHADTTDIWNKNNIKLCRSEINEEPGVASRDRGEAYGFEESASNPSDFLTMLCWEEAVRNKSLNKGSLKQLLPVSSNWWYRSNVHLTNASAACLTILLLLEFFPLDAPRQACQLIICQATLTYDVIMQYRAFYRVSLVTTATLRFLACDLVLSSFRLC
jgi:hypothetical protein